MGTSLLFFGLFVAMLYVATSKVVLDSSSDSGFFAVGAVAATFLFDARSGSVVDGWLNALDR